MVNPLAGGGKDPSVARRLRKILDGRGEVTECRNLADLPGILRGFHQAGLGLIAVYGGDGSNLYALTALARIYGPEALPPVALLRGGTVNTVARGLGITGKPEEILERLVGMHDRRVPYPLQAVRTLAVNQHLGFIFGAAMPARFFEAYYQGRGRGLGKGARVAVHLALSAARGGPFSARLFAPVPVELVVDGEPTRLRAITGVIASTVENTPLGFKPCYRARERLDRFQIVAVCDPPRRISREIFRLHAGRPLTCPTLVDRLATRTLLRLESDEPYLLDGELFRAREVRLGLGPVVRIAGLKEEPTTTSAGA